MHQAQKSWCHQLLPSKCQEPSSKTLPPRVLISYANVVVARKTKVRNSILFFKGKDEIIVINYAVIKLLKLSTADENEILEKLLRLRSVNSDFVSLIFGNARRSPPEAVQL